MRKSTFRNTSLVLALAIISLCTSCGDDNEFSGCIVLVQLPEGSSEPMVKTAEFAIGETDVSLP